MTQAEFKNTFSESKPPEELSNLQAALWYALKDEWDAAHNIAQQYEGDKNFDRLHAYLHRAEGDEWNANYWYRRAETTMPAVTLQQELEGLLALWI